MIIETYYRFKPVWDSVLSDLVEFDGTREFDVVFDTLKIGHLRQLAGLGFVVEVGGPADLHFSAPPRSRAKFSITESGRLALRGDLVRQPNRTPIDVVTNLGLRTPEVDAALIETGPDACRNMDALEVERSSRVR